MKVSCPQCNGTGRDVRPKKPRSYWNDYTCSMCQGSGKIHKRRKK